MRPVSRKISATGTTTTDRLEWNGRCPSHPSERARTKAPRSTARLGSTTKASFKVQSCMSQWQCGGGGGRRSQGTCSIPFHVIVDVVFCFATRKTIFNVQSLDIINNKWKMWNDSLKCAPFKYPSFVRVKLFNRSSWAWNEAIAQSRWFDIVTEMFEGWVTNTTFQQQRFMINGRGKRDLRGLWGPPTMRDKNDTQMLLCGKSDELT